MLKWYVAILPWDYHGASLSNRSANFSWHFITETIIPAFLGIETLLNWHFPLFYQWYSYVNLPFISMNVCSWRILWLLVHFSASALICLSSFVNVTLVKSQITAWYYYEIRFDPEEHLKVSRNLPLFLIYTFRTSVPGQHVLNFNMHEMNQ